jgi:hypothetical protein
MERLAPFSGTSQCSAPGLQHLFQFLLHLNNLGTCWLHPQLDWKSSRRRTNLTYSGISCHSSGHINWQMVVGRWMHLLFNNYFPKYLIWWGNQISTLNLALYITRVLNHQQLHRVPFIWSSHLMKSFPVSHGIAVSYSWDLFWCWPCYPPSTFVPGSLASDSKLNSSHSHLTWKQYAGIQRVKCLV